jgi:hypothetical protein
VSWFFTKGVPKVDFSKCEFVGEFEDFHFMTPDIPTAFRRVSESCFNQYRQDFCRLLPYAYGTHFSPRLRRKAASIGARFSMTV